MIAERVAEIFGAPGDRLWNQKGENLHEVCVAHGADVETHPEEPYMTRYVFSDGSAIVATELAWDIEGSDPWSWAGEEALKR